MLGIEKTGGGSVWDALFKETITYAFNQRDVSSFGFTYIHKSSHCAEINCILETPPPPLPSEKE